LRYRRRWPEAGNLFFRCRGPSAGNALEQAMERSEANYRKTFRVSWNGSAPAFTERPSLPEPLANAAAVIVGADMYVAGGQTTPTVTETSRGVYLLDTRQTSGGWKRLPDCPGPGWNRQA
jgi:hypothetical protein